MHEQQIASPERLAGSDDALEQGAQLTFPDLAPHLAAPTSERFGMFGAEDRPVGIVVQQDELRPPEHRTICAFDGSSMLTVLRRLWGHDSGGPSGVPDQSSSRIRAPISPPPARKVSSRGSTGSLLLIAATKTRSTSNDWIVPTQRNTRQAASPEVEHRFIRASDS